MMQSGAILRDERSEVTCKRCNDGRRGRVGSANWVIRDPSHEQAEPGRETEIVSSIRNQVTRITMEIIAGPAS